jgi:hypothetical protein
MLDARSEPVSEANIEFDGMPHNKNMSHQIITRD